MNKIERAAQIARFVLDRFLIVFFFCLLIIHASREVADLDLWLHLKTGEVIVSQKTIPQHDIFSFSIEGRPWVNHEWLFQVLAYLSMSWGSFDGLIAMQNIVVLATFLILFLAGRGEKNHLFLFVVLYLTLLATAYRFSIRPDIFSIFFLTLYLFILRKFTEENSRAVWGLPILQMAWQNMHGFSFVGPLVVLIFLAGEGVKKMLPGQHPWSRTQRLDARQIKTLAAVFLLLLVAGIVNPQGLKGAAYPLSVLGSISGKGRIVFQYIQELARPITFKSLFTPAFLFYKAVILGSLFSFRFNRKNIDIATLILWVFFLCFSFLAIRNVAYFAAVAGFVALDNVRAAMNAGNELPISNTPRNIKILAYYGCMAFLFFYGAKGARQYLEAASFNFDTYELKSSLWGINRQRYPEKAADFLLRHDFPPRLFNDFNSGAYLIGRAYPQRRVFIDGRTELYGPEFFKKYVEFGEGKKDALDEVLRQYDIQGFFLTLPTHDLHMGLLRTLTKSPEWKTVYFDESALIILRDIPENAGHIKKFQIDLRNWAPPPPDFLKIGIAHRHPGPFLRRARLLNGLGLHEAAGREARIALDIMPHNAEALTFMADYHVGHKNFHEAFKCIRAALIHAGGDISMRAKLALIYHGLGEKEKAVKVADSVIKKAPKYAQGHYTKALIIKEENKEGAIELLREAAKIAPKEPKYRQLLGDLLAEAGDIDEAKKEWAAALEYDSADPIIKKKLDSVSR